MTALRHRVPISRATSPESPNTPRQRLLLYVCGSGENHFPEDDGQFAAKVSVGNFGATVLGSESTDEGNVKVSGLH